MVRVGILNPKAKVDAMIFEKEQLQVKVSGHGRTKDGAHLKYCSNPN